MSERPPRYASLLAGLDLAGFRAIAAILREGVILLDRDLRIRDLNPAAARILDRDAGDLIGQPVCSLFGEGDCPQDTLAASLGGSRAILDFQTTVRLPGDRRGSVLLRSAPLAGRDGAAGGIALIIGDVTEETRLRRETEVRARLGDLVGRDRRMRELYNLIERVAPSDVTVLIRGESGTGKELVARALHAGSHRAEGPFISVNCSALAETLLESELFGHVRGAYTGAAGDRRGRFEEASGGTIFLDEIGDVSSAVQVKLLRVLQERVIERVGASQPIAVDVRVISATNQNLEALLATGRLREDFYYRLKVVRLDLPPLRQRREDIPLLAEHLLARRGVGPVTIAPDALARLMQHDWPGNVRELENALEHALVLSRDRTIHAEHLPPEIGAGVARGPTAGLAAVARGSAAERELLRDTLRATGWNRTRAARRLGIDRTTLWRKLKEHELEPEPEP
ncbi:MAG TPA: sigma 54-interacting transcriptional regulator [Candidatus Krumholzibacteria bacterium]|nr:sigma 54-interacting transcriptional regulator [Candidatus Krumholzibacteria bacterium]HPD72356.1 sigma 54-interacting transcriptional regulator [Candidatus Krumholzibacteria bacterium]HRY40712.1 sigma 54-interacting transcriptional regulator [Candidatus Krumholzibacteria bacterium]